MRFISYTKASFIGYSFFTIHAYNSNPHCNTTIPAHYRLRSRCACMSPRHRVFPRPVRNASRLILTRRDAIIAEKAPELSQWTRHTHRQNDSGAHEYWYLLLFQSLSWCVVSHDVNKLSGTGDNHRRRFFITLLLFPFAKHSQLLFLTKRI